MSVIDKAFRGFLSAVPRYNRYLFKVACLYQDRYRNENNLDIAANGELRLLRWLLPQCRVVFDVGANVGDWSDMASRANPQAHIHCFEPFVESYAALTARRLPRNVVPNNIALDSEPGNRPLFVNAMFNTMNSLQRLDGMEPIYGPQQAGAHLVTCETIDSYCAARSVEYIDFLKVDVEGSEMSVLRGGREMMRRRAIRAIQFEHNLCAVASRTLLADYFAYLAPFGYSLYKIQPHGLWRLPRYDCRLETFNYANYFAALDLDDSASTPLPAWR